ncbi:MAG: biosynthetic arginine decarboxylase [Planctomycetota bacterium]
MNPSKLSTTNLGPSVEPGSVENATSVPETPQTNPTVNVELGDQCELQPNSWTTADANELYGVNRWGMGYFDVASNGNATYLAPGPDVKHAVEFSKIIDGLRQRGLDMPVMLRLENVVNDRISTLNKAFQSAIQTCEYQSSYRGVFPIKVNQQAHVIDKITRFGEQFGHGLEAGSKAELLIAMSHLRSRESLIICNGYKDEEFVDLGCQALRIGFKCFFVIETLKEVPLILERAKHWGVKPLIGVRVKLSTTVDGHWSNDSGDRSLFGLSTVQLIKMVDQLREAQMLDCLQLLHFHLGSQIPNIRNIRDGVSEACRFYLDLLREGAPLGYLDIGGGLAVDYDGTASTTTNSRNYDLDEYCIDIIEAIMASLDPHDVAHPVVVSESGRWTVAPMSVLIFNVLEVNRFSPQPLPAVLPENVHESVDCLIHTLEHIETRRLQENYNDAIYYRDQARKAFRDGQLNLRGRALAENICLNILHSIAKRVPELRRPPAVLQAIDDSLSDIYYGNFSVFQSLPDSWAIEQVFPVMPLQRLNEEPTQSAIIGDLTCDCDGKLDRFSGHEGDASTLKLHSIDEDEDYCIGVFLVGAYQETLGDLHNLFGDANVASVRVEPNGQLKFVHELEGDSIGDVLSYVEYEPNEIFKRFRVHAEEAVECGVISLSQRQQMLKLVSESLRGYTYFEAE